MSVRRMLMMARYRRIFFWVVLIIMCYAFYQIMHKNGRNATGKVSGISTTTTFIPPTEPPLPNQWLIVEITEHPEICITLAMALPEWTILMVGIESNAQHSHSRCRYFTNQEASRFIKDSSLPITTTTFKASLLPIGYLYAIFNGAELIHVPSQNANLRMMEAPPIVLPGRKHTGLTYVTHPDSYFNTNVHFGCNVSDLEQGPEQSPVYQLCEHSTVPVIQSSAIVGPLQQVVAADIDISLQQETVMYCDSMAPAVTLTPETFAPLNLEDTTFLKDAFWALPVLSGQAEVFQEAWNLIVQKLLWMTGSEKGINRVLIYFHGTQDQIAAGYNQRTAPLRKYLSLKKYTKSTFLDCVFALISDLTMEGYLNGNLGDLVIVWLKSLERTGYLFPEVLHEIQKETPLENCAESAVVYHSVNYKVPLVTKQYRRKPYVPVANLKTNNALFESMCKPIKTKETNDAIVDLPRAWQQYENILLVITFNKDHYEALPYIEALYRSFFPNILYCGPGKPDATKYAGLRGLNFSFVSYGTTPDGHVDGAFNYQCVTFAIDMHYNVHGYMVIADDILIAIHPFNKLMDMYKQTSWFLPKKDLRVGEILKLRECKLGMCDFYPHWDWWEEYRPNVIKLFYSFKELQSSSTVVHKCYSALKQYNGADMRPCGGYSDIYYIPKRIADDFSELSKIFLKHEVFLEIAVPSLIRCLEIPEDVQGLQGKQLWELDRTSPWIYFTPKDLVGKHYLHPTKWSGLAKKDPNATHFYCNKVMPFLHDPYARYEKS